jgi:hypothetical protein
VSSVTMTDTAHVLVVAHRTAATPPLLDAVRERAAQGPATFTLLVPKSVHGLDRLTDPEDVPDDGALLVVELAVPLLEEAAGGPVEAVIGSAEPLAAVQDVVNTRDVDEIILSTLPTHLSRWLRLDLPRKVAALGLPVTTITAKERAGAPA